VCSRALLPSPQPTLHTFDTLPYSSLLVMSSDAKWKALVADKQRRQQESIPAAWRIDAPGPEVLNVMDVPQSCGLLSALELEITEITDVDVLLERLAAGTWSSVQVTTAFYKRAIVAQQIVSSLCSSCARRY
jgi:amidase